MSKEPRAVLLGAAAGTLATVAMSGCMYGLQRIGLLGRAPPRHIVERALLRLHLRRRVPPRQRQLLTAISHLGFGATQGAVFALLQGLRARRGESPLASARGGVPFALAVWAASYAGWIPALGILPPPSRDRPGRPTSMVLAHVAYGVALSKLLRLAGTFRLDQGGERGDAVANSLPSSGSRTDADTTSAQLAE